MIMDVNIVANHTDIVILMAVSEMITKKLNYLYLLILLLEHLR
jgi:hypothetical protein